MVRERKREERYEGKERERPISANFQTFSLPNAQSMAKQGKEELIEVAYICLKYSLLIIELIYGLNIEYGVHM